MRWFTLQFDFASGDTTKTAQFPTGLAGGVAKCTKVKIPDFASTPTITLQVFDSVPDVLYSKASIVDNAITLITDVFPIVPGGKAVLTATGAPGSAMSCYVTFFVFSEN